MYCCIIAHWIMCVTIQAPLLLCIRVSPRVECCMHSAALSIKHCLCHKPFYIHVPSSYVSLHLASSIASITSCAHRYISMSITYCKCQKLLSPRSLSTLWFITQWNATLLNVATSFCNNGGFRDWLCSCCCWIDGCIGACMYGQTDGWMSLQLENLAKYK